MTISRSSSKESTTISSRGRTRPASVPTRERCLPQRHRACWLNCGTPHRAIVIRNIDDDDGPRHQFGRSSKPLAVFSPYLHQVSPDVDRPKPRNQRLRPVPHNGIRTRAATLCARRWPRFRRSPIAGERPRMTAAAGFRSAHAHWTRSSPALLRRCTRLERCTSSTRRCSLPTMTTPSGSSSTRSVSTSWRTRQPRPPTADRSDGSWYARPGPFLRVEEFDAAHRRLREHGVQFVSEPRDELYGRVCVFVDIAGNRWDLLGPPS